MKEKALQKTMGILLAAMFAAGIFAAPVSAKPHKVGCKLPGQSQHIRHSKNRSDIVMDVLGCSSRDFWRARSAGMTLEDLIAAVYIAHELKDRDFEEVFRMKKNGKPYKEICKAYGINWGSVRRNIDKDYGIMSDDAVKAGLVMWGLQEVLN